MATNEYTAKLLDDLHAQLGLEITDEARESVADNEDVQNFVRDIYDLAIEQITTDTLTEHQALYAIDAANVALSIAISAQYVGKETNTLPDEVLNNAMKATQPKEDRD